MFRFPGNDAGLASGALVPQQMGEIIAFKCTTVNGTGSSQTFSLKRNAKLLIRGCRLYRTE